MFEITSRRPRRTSTTPVRKSVCFQRIPSSSSCMQIALRDRHRAAVGGDGGDVEVVDRAEAVAAEGQRVGHRADVELADVERRLVEAVRVGVGDDHLGDRRPVQDRAQLAAVLVADIVQHDALAAVESHPQVPLLPAHVVAPRPSSSGPRAGDVDRPTSSRSLIRSARYSPSSSAAPAPARGPRSGAPRRCSGRRRRRSPRAGGRRVAPGVARARVRQEPGGPATVLLLGRSV